MFCQKRHESKVSVYFAEFHDASVCGVCPLPVCTHIVIFDGLPADVCICLCVRPFECVCVCVSMSIAHWCIGALELGCARPAFWHLRWHFVNTEYQLPKNIAVLSILKFNSSVWSHFHRGQQLLLTGTTFAVQRNSVCGSAEQHLLLTGTAFVVDRRNIICSNSKLTIIFLAAQNETTACTSKHALRLI